MILRAIGEGLLIVVSVLLALSADAWLDERKQDQQRLDYVMALARDFELMAERARASFDASDRALQSGIELTRALASKAVIDKEKSISSIRNLGFYEVFSPSVGAYESMVASGDIELLTDRELKNTLATFFGSFDDLRVSEQILINGQSRFFESAEFSRLIGFHRLGLGFFDLPTIDDAHLHEWADSEEIINGIALTTANHKDVREDYPFLLERIQEIEKLLAAERTYK